MGNYLPIDSMLERKAKTRPVSSGSIQRVISALYKNNRGIIPCEITHSKYESLPIAHIVSTQSVHPMRFHNPEYQPPVTSGSRLTGCTNFVN